MTALYDLMLLIDPNAPEDRQSAVISEVESSMLIRRRARRHPRLGRRAGWPTRSTTGPRPHYRLYQFEAEPPLLERLHQRLRIMDGVLRFRIIRLKPGSPPPPPPRDAPPRPRETASASRTAAWPPGRRPMRRPRTTKG